jgi:ketosteroid isomerase-like protein
MGDAEVRLCQWWSEQLAASDDPLALFYEQIWAPDIDYRAAEGALDDLGPIVGRDAMRAYAADWYEMFTDLEFVPDEILDAGPERAIVVWHMSGKAKASGAPTDMRFAALYTIRGGKIVRGREYMTRDDAFAAAATEG